LIFVFLDTTFDIFYPLYKGLVMRIWKHSSYLSYSSLPCRHACIEYLLITLDIYFGIVFSWLRRWALNNVTYTKTRLYSQGDVRSGKVYCPQWVTSWFFIFLQYLVDLHGM
jgi:hypothetical protein